MVSEDVGLEVECHLVGMLGVLAVLADDVPPVTRKVLDFELGEHAHILELRVRLDRRQHLDQVVGQVVHV